MRNSHKQVGQFERLLTREGKYSIFFEQYEKIPDFIAAVGANFTLNVPSCHLHKLKLESQTHEEFFHPPTGTRISTALYHEQF